MFFNDKEIEVYGLIQPNEKKLEKARKIYSKLSIEGMMNFKGFYHLWGEEVQSLNINKVHSFEELIIKLKKLKKYRKMLARAGKISRCFNCIWRKPRTQMCLLCKSRTGDLVFYVNKHDNFKCENFIRRDIW